MVREFVATVPGPMLTRLARPSKVRLAIEVLWPNVVLPRLVVLAPVA